MMRKLGKEYWVSLLLLLGLATPNLRGEDSTLGNSEFYAAMTEVASGTLEGAKRAVEWLSAAESAHPKDPFYAELNTELKILFRAEFTSANTRKSSEEAEKKAEGKLKSMKMMLVPSKLTGKANPELAEKYRIQAEEILADAEILKAQANHNLILALQRANQFVSRLLDRGEGTAAVSLCLALQAIAERNPEAVSEAEPPFAIPLSPLELQDLIDQTKVRHTMVKNGMREEQKGNIEGALKRYQLADFKAGINRLADK